MVNTNRSAKTDLIVFNNSFPKIIDYCKLFDIN